MILEEKMVVTFFVSFFLIVQLFGLYLGNGYLNLIKAGQAEPAFENPESIGNSLFLFGYIIAATIGIILIVKYVKFFIRVLEVVAVFAGTLLTFYILFPQNILVDFVLALILNVWRIFRPSSLLQNLSLALVIPSIGALIGTSLGVIPSLIFIVLLSIYDFVSVFITKHMIYMAKEITKRPSAFALSMPYKFKKLKTFVHGKRELKKKLHVFQLG
ncbi:MAG TPA: presenilin family intramembrane aspartyl protease, partial [archaeon]|nr:presenilin family intramembrane aspartyl protease [archaeon]